MLLSSVDVAVSHRTRLTRVLTPLSASRLVVHQQAHVQRRLPISMSTGICADILGGKGLRGNLPRL